MARDEARARARSAVGEEAFDRAEAEWMAAAREEKVWAVEIAPAPGGIREDPDAGLSLVMVTAGEWVVHGEVLSHRPAGVAERTRDLAAAVNTAARVLGVLPETLYVQDRELEEPLGRELGGRGITVEYGDPEQMFNAMNAALAHLDSGPAAGRMVVALTWRETEASAQELAEFHEAAAAFYTAAPWASEETEGPFLLDLPREAGEDLAGLDPSELRPWAASVMGAMGESFGVALYSQPGDLADILTAADALQAAMEAIGFSLTVDFDRKAELTRAMQREIAAARWPIAGPGAYPRLFGLNLPSRRVLAREVRLATLALRALTVHARGGDALAETGVGVTEFDPDAEYEDRLDWFHTPEHARPICAEGPGAVPEASLRLWDLEAADMEVAAEERVQGFETWLGAQGVPEAEVEADARNSAAWEWFMASVCHAGAVTEFDLRLFLYDAYPRKCDPAPEAVRALSRSMRRIVRWVEEHDQVRYPFAAGVLDELEAIEARAREAGEPLEETLRILSSDIYDDLDYRAQLPDDDLPGIPGGWPGMMKIDVARLRHELQRRWLLWHDELVRGGTTDFEELREALVARQRAWESTPHPTFDGRTPAEVIMENAR